MKVTKLLMLCLLFPLLQAKRILIYAPYWSEEMRGDHFFIRECRNRGHTVKVIKYLRNLGEFDYLVFHEITQWDEPFIKTISLEKLVLFILESPVILPLSYDKTLHQHFKYVFTWNDDLVDNKKYIKIYYPYPEDRVYKKGKDFKDKDFSAFFITDSFIESNSEYYQLYQLYSCQKELLSFFENISDDFFHSYSYIYYPYNYKHYKGVMSDKLALIQNYKYIFTYENSYLLSGCITERIFDTMINGAVPIYKGASNIKEYIPENCFILADDFTKLSDLYNNLLVITEEEYNQYLFNIQEFLLSENFKKFYRTNLMNKFFTLIEGNA